MDKGKFREKVTSDLKKYHVPVAETVDKELARLRRVEAAAREWKKAKELFENGVMERGWLAYNELISVKNRAETALKAALEEGV